MLNPFPELLHLGILAPFFFRLFLGIFFLSLGTALIKDKAYEKAFLSIAPPSARISYGILAILGGALLTVGAWTQYIAMVLIALIAGLLLVQQKAPKHIPYPPLFFYALLLMLVSLLITGAGIFAFDRPL